MLTLEYKVKPQRTAQGVFLPVPEWKKHHLKQGDHRTDPYVNSNLLPQIIQRTIRQSALGPCVHQSKKLNVANLPEGVEVIEGFLFTVTIRVAD